MGTYDAGAYFSLFPPRRRGGNTPRCHLPFHHRDSRKCHTSSRFRSSHMGRGSSGVRFFFFLGDCSQSMPCIFGICKDGVVVAVVVVVATRIGKGRTLW
ncbi:hypothetical protein LX32DRAFT_212655 [Colletotrichum zoysiae]|uniref:Uncharacterized protein n=1 Tax=Colletotrichum zoysiae TaxID=1216348 RepID=A0AAD9H4N2_9PEZI|nr:hypothetical protein LX32DRAFT_212655 [Colletotrichum zoysiae]